MIARNVSGKACSKMKAKYILMMIISIMLYPLIGSLNSWVGGTGTPIVEEAFKLSILLISYSFGYIFGRLSA